MRAARILIVDDEENMRHFLVKLLEAEGFEAAAAPDVPEALALAREGAWDLALLDMRLPGGDGIALLRSLRAEHPDLRGVMITAFGSIDTAVEAMKAGAYDYVTKPFRADDILRVVGRALEEARLRREVRDLRRAVRARYGFASLVGRGPRMQAVFDQIPRIAHARSTVLICGESGTGKELVARAVHYESDRRDRPFIVIDCAAVPENLQESELFGHQRGAFTGAVATKRGLVEEADGGSLFLDEVGELSPATQAKLLRLLQEGTFRRVGDTRLHQVDLRVIVATNRELAADVAAGRFREDLFYRLNVVAITLPPLRERAEDIPLLAQHFAEKYARETGKPVKALSRETLELLEGLPWPGNVRQLENAIERAVLYCEGELIRPADLPPELRASPAAGTGNGPGGFRLKPAVARVAGSVERQLIARALEEARGSRTRAARLLGISRRGLLYKLRDLGIGKGQ